MTDDGGVWVKIGGNESTTEPAIVSGGTATTYVDSGITYQVNTFTSDATLNVSSAGIADILIVGGGASGGGRYYGGGGGAGAAPDDIPPNNMAAILSFSNCSAVFTGATGAAVGVLVDPPKPP